MKYAHCALAALLCGTVPAAPAMAAKTVVIDAVADDGFVAPPPRHDDGQGQTPNDEAYDTIARFVRDARFEVAKSVTVGENPMLDPFVDNVGRSGQERSSLGDFRLPPNTRQMLREDGGGGFLGLFTLSTVPEPSQWMMLILGIGLIGTGLRRKRSARPGVEAG